MYYTGTDDPDGYNNKIGVAFSTNGKSWIKYANNPIITSQWGSTGHYGAGQAQVHNANGGSNIRLWYADVGTDNIVHIYERTSPDGFSSWTTPIQLSENGIPTDPYIGYRTGGAAIAFRYDGDGLFMLRTKADLTDIRLFNISTAQRFNGTWTPLGNITASDNIFESGFRTDIYGNLTSLTWPTIFAGFGAGTWSTSSTWKLMQSSGAP
jgi:hypothetical protein